MPVQKPFWDYFWLAKYFFQFIGILPLGGPSSLCKSIYFESLAAYLLAYGIYLVIQPMDYILFRRDTVDDSLEALMLVLASMGVQLRSIFVTVHRRKFVRLFTACEKLWNHATPADYDVILTSADRARLLSTTYFFAGQFVPELFALTSTIRQLSLPANSTLKYYPYGLEDDLPPSPQFEIKYALQVINGHLAMAVVTAVDVAGIFVALILCGQLALIRSWLLNMSVKKSDSGSEEIDQQVKEGLKECIIRHQQVMNFCAELEEAVRYINLTQVLTGMYIFAISSARLMKGIKSYRNYGPFLLALSGFFFSCWPAESLTFASNEVTRAIYELPWYRYLRREKIAVAIMLARSQRSAQLTAGKFVVLSLETFSSIVCNGFSFCMVINSF